MVKGPDRTPVEMDEEYETSKAEFARTYTWIEWDLYSDRYTGVNDTTSDRGILAMYNDDYFKNHTWIWDNKPHWAYKTKFMNLVADRKAIEWTPNTIESKVIIEGNKAKISLNSNTPNLKTYQMKEMSDSNWKNVSTAVEIELKNDKNEIVFRTVNLGGVTGPEHKVIIERD